MGSRNRNRQNSSSSSSDSESSSESAKKSKSYKHFSTSGESSKMYKPSRQSEERYAAERERSPRRHPSRDRYGSSNSRDYRDKNPYRSYDNRKHDFKARDNRRRERRSRSRSFDHANARWGRQELDKDTSKKRDPQDKQKPNFSLSGKLTEETNTYRGVVIKYSEPPDARKPRRRWRLYPFKGEKALQTLYIHRESGYLIGRERKVVDLPVDHPSCSKQHAALQYRLVSFTRDDGSVGKRVRPFIMDLESANGTYINNKKIDSKKYIELFEKDVIKFGFSSREYVLLHENSKDEGMDDDVKQEENIKFKKEEVKIKEER